MKKRKSLFIGVIGITSFILWTLMVSFVDVKKIGAEKTNVGFATVNKIFHDLTGVHLKLYDITDWLGVIPICIVLLFAIVGFVQLVKRKKLKYVDSDILLLGVFYIFTLFVFIFFEFFVINYRPILINGNLEASYPSSTTLLVMCVMPTAALQVRLRINNYIIKYLLNFLITLFMIFMVLARLISGVHWLTDIIGGALISIGLVATYNYLLETIINLNNK